MTAFLERVIAIRAAEQCAVAFRSPSVVVPEDKIDIAKHRAALTKLGLTLKDAADLCGVSLQWYKARRDKPNHGWREHVERSLYLEPGALK